MRRHLIGILALLLLAGAVAFWIWPPGSEGWQLQLHAACWRMGFLLGAIWLAFDQAERIPAWIWAAVPVLVFVLARYPRWILVVLPLVIALAVLKRLEPKRQ